LLSVSKFLKVSALLTPGLPDAEMGSRANQKILFDKLVPFARRHQPALIISFGEDGISGHVDHIAVGKVARRVAIKLHIRLVAFSAPPALQKSREMLKKRRKHGKYVKNE